MNDALLDSLIGGVVRASAVLEMTLRDVARQLLSPQPEEVDADGRFHPEAEWLQLEGRSGKAITQFSRLVSLVEAKAAASPLLTPDDELDQRLRKLLSCAGMAYQLRNRWVHDPPLAIHPPELTLDGPTHRRIRLDRPVPMVDVDLDELARLLYELRLYSVLCTSVSSQLLARNMAAMGQPHYLADRLDEPFVEYWRIFDSLPASGTPTAAPAAPDSRNSGQGSDSVTGRIAPSSSVV